MFHPLFSPVLRFAGPVSYDSHHKHTIHDNFLETTKISHFEFHAKFGMACCASRPNKGRTTTRDVCIFVGFFHSGPSCRTVDVLLFVPGIRFGDVHGGHESQMNHIGPQLVQLNLGFQTCSRSILGQRMPQESQKKWGFSGGEGWWPRRNPEKRKKLIFRSPGCGIFIRRVTLCLIDTHGSWHSSQYVNLQIHVLHA